MNLFTKEELEAIAETYHDYLKDFPSTRLYSEIERKAEKMIKAGQFITYISAKW